MAILAGHFNYRLTDNGNLTGEFANNQSTRPQTESADRMQEGNTELECKKFEGVYRSTWFEPDVKNALMMKLVITKKHGAEQIFRLEWLKHPSKSVLFKGEAMISEGLLVGNYWPA